MLGTSRPDVRYLKAFALGTWAFLLLGLALSNVESNITPVLTAPVDKKLTPHRVLVRVSYRPWGLGANLCCPCSECRAEDSFS